MFLNTFKILPGSSPDHLSQGEPGFVLNHRHRDALPDIPVSFHFTVFLHLLCNAHGILTEVF